MTHNFNLKVQSTSVQGKAKAINKNELSLESRINRRNFLFFIFLPLFFASCSTAKIYTKPDALSYTMKHKTLAILPPKVHLEVKKKDKVENVQAQEMTESTDAQNEMNSRFLDFVQKGNLYIDIQSVEKTNATFVETGYPYDMSPEELAKALGVDAILYTDCVYSKANNVASGIACAILLFPYGTVWGIMEAVTPTYIASVNAKLYDGSTGYLLYSYSGGVSGLGTKYPFLIDKATKKIVKKMPYYRK